MLSGKVETTGSRSFWLDVSNHDAKQNRGSKMNLTDVGCIKRKTEMKDKTVELECL